MIRLGACEDAISMASCVEVFYNKNMTKNDIFDYIFIFILLNRKKAREARIRRVSDYPNLLPEMPKYCCSLKM